MTIKKNYTVYFELFGKKMKTKILAESKEDAQNIIKSKVKFHKIIIDKNDEFNQCIDVFDNIMDILDKK